MTFIFLAYAAGLLTIASPCILPILPIIAARADQPFRRAGLPLLVGLALTFAVVASLASVAGGWAVDANRYGRGIALGGLVFFGLTMLLPGFAAWTMAPFVSLGVRLSDWAGDRAAVENRTTLTSLLLGIATGLVWAPCAGPVLGLILTGAALNGPSSETTFLLLAYGLGAATSLAGGLLLGGRLLAPFKRSSSWNEGLRRVLGAAVVVGTIAIAAGLDTGVLTRLSTASTTAFENTLVHALQPARAEGTATTVRSAQAASLPAPLSSVLGTKQWLNTPALAAGDLRSKVVLVNFWTYSCINCLRVLPYVRAWAEKYKDQGLVVIGVHTPEFAFEKDVDNVRNATGMLGVKYPVAIDSDFRIWRAFDNNAWPAIYFIDANGVVRHQAIGEGDYIISEKVIQKLLAEANHKPEAADLAKVEGDGAQAAADGVGLRSSETYLGFGQASGFFSPGGARSDEPSTYRHVAKLPLNKWTLGGAWTIGREFAVLGEKGGSIAFHFQARDLHLVIGPSSQTRPTRFRVTIDGMPPGADHGADADADGWGMLKDTRLYQLVRQAAEVRDRTFKIEFDDPGVKAYVFTFG
jgi:cytochrome c biogenesis protein CcdA/thiol-disulfide isomerase/thioredoxin